MAGKFVEVITSDQLTTEEWASILKLNLMPMHKQFLEVFRDCENRPMDRYEAWDLVAERYGYARDAKRPSFDSVSAALRNKKTPYRFRSTEKNHLMSNPVKLVKVRRCENQSPTP